MDIEIGRDVFASDGEKVGTVEGLVIDSGTNELRRIVIGGGIFSGSSRLVDVSAITASGADGVRLDIAAKDADRLPQFAREDHVEVTRRDEPAMIMPAMAVGGPIFYENPTTGAGYPGGGGLFDPAPIDPPPLEVESNLETNEVMLRKGAEVVGADGDKVGTVDEVLTGDREAVTGFVVKSGFLFKHDVHIPMEWVKEIDDQRVHLSVTADEAERQGRHDAD